MPATTLANCSYAYDRASSLGGELVNLDFASHVFAIYACTPFKWEYAVNLLCVVLCLVLFRWLYEKCMQWQRRGAPEPFSLAKQLTLTTHDNAALAIDFASFLFGMCWITRGSLTDLEPGVDTARYFGSFFAYQVVGSAVIVASRVINDKLVLRKVDNIQAMVDDHSVAVACVQAGTTVATALIFAASSGGRESSFGEGLGMTLIFWAVGQVLLVSYITVVDGVTSLPYVSAFSSKLIQRHTVTPTANGAVSSDSSDGGLKATSLFEEAASGNTAAGLSVGLDLVHAGIVITSPIYVGYGLLPWVIYVSIVLGIVSPVIHLYLDHIIMRGVAYSVNVLRHRHWGAAALLGSLKILLALVLMSSYSQNCDPATLSDEFCTEKFPASFVARLGHVSIPDVFTMHVLSNLIILLLFMLVAKAIYFVRFACKDGVSAARTNLRTFSLDAMVADPENNAIAVSLAAFTFAMGLTLVGVVRCPEDNAGRHAAAVLQWTAIGGVLLVLAFAINDCVLLAKISNTEALAQNNVAVACFEAGSLVACGVILRGSLTGGGSNYTMGESLALTVLFWAVSQLMLLIIAYIYRCITFFDDWEQLKKGNVAAGVSGGCTLVALAIIMAYPIPMYVSLLIFVPISVVGIAALMVVRKLVDKCVLPGNALDKEIVDDQNWGAAIIEGGVVVGIAFISNMYVPPPGAPFVSESIPYWDVCQ